LIKIPGEHNSADLMTKHLTFIMIKRHLDSLFLEFKEGRSDKAAKLHSVTRLARQELAASKLVNVDNSFASVSGGDYWAERGELGRWVRVHTHPRTSAFLPWKVPGGPGRKTRLTQERSTRGVDMRGQKFQIDDKWNGRTFQVRRRLHGQVGLLSWLTRTTPIAGVPINGARELRPQTSYIIPERERVRFVRRRSSFNKVSLDSS